MRTLSFFLFLAAAVAIYGAPPFVYESASEFQAGGDLNGDGLADLVIVDKATGAYRIAYQLSPGNYSWVSARASGIANATGLGIGTIDSLTFDSIVLTGPDANRLNVLDANDTSVAGVPASVFLPSLGPNVVAAIDIGGLGNTPNDDLYVASLYNNAPVFRETLIRNDGTTNRTVLADNPLSFMRERANAVLLHTNRSPALALFERYTSVGFDTFQILDLSSGAAVNVTSVSVSRSPTPPEYVTGQFNSSNPYTQFLTYSPSDSKIADYQVVEPVPGTYALVLSNTFSIADSIDRIFVVPGTNGLRLLVLDTNGISASIYAFDGQTAPSLVQSLTAPPGEHFTGAAALGNGGFMAYSSALGENTSTRFHQFRWNGSAYANTASGSLPRISVYAASGNVMQFQNEPFVTNNPVLLRLNSAGDWTSGLAFSGLPGNISVRTETFLSSTQGLMNPVVTGLGAAHPLAAFGLANQYSNMISLFSFTPPAGDKISDVTISPLPGIYPTSVQVQFKAANPSDNIFFRISSGVWTTWTNTLVVELFTNTTVQYYGQPTNGVGKSLIKTAAYYFTQGPSTFDSKGDGIPDYVKIALGLPLTGSRDSDGDGYSDLEELIHGTDPLNPASVPTNYPHLDDQAVFDLDATPYPWDGFSNQVSLCATGVVLHGFDFQGSLLGSGSTGTNTWPVAPLTNLIMIAEDRLLSYSTDPHFDILTTNTDTKVGREMVGLVALPPITFPAVPYVYGGGNITNEALNWIAAASNVFNNLPRKKLNQNLKIDSTLESALFELKIAQLFCARAYPSWSNITLFPNRPHDAGRTNPVQTLMLSLEEATTNQPGYKLQTVFAGISNLVENSSAPSIASLRAIVQDIYRIDSVFNNTNPATFALPLDEIRYFLWNGTLDSNYLARATTAGQFAAGTTGASAVLNAVAARPTTNIMLVVRSDTLGACRILDVMGASGTFALQGSSALPFSFPNNFQLLPGSVVQVAGYTDVTNPSCAYPAIEVTSVSLNSVPIATDADLNGNLLIDSWENRFFGGVGLVSPFGDADGDGYQNLQEMLDGTDPTDPFSHNPNPPVHFAPPTLALEGNGTQVELHFLWPAAYVNRFAFGVLHTSDLNVPFSNIVASGPISVAGDEFKVSFTIPSTSENFYLLAISLR